MNSINSDSIGGEETRSSFESHETLVATGNGQWIRIPTGVQSVAITLDATLGIGKIQVSSDSLIDIKNDIASKVMDWDAGIVTNAYSNDVFFPCTAIREVNISGTTSIGVRDKTQSLMQRYLRKTFLHG